LNVNELLKNNLNKQNINILKRLKWCMNKKNEIIEIFSGTSWEVGIVKSLLDNAEIESFLKDDIMGTLNPWHTAAGDAQLVNEAQKQTLKTW